MDGTDYHGIHAYPVIQSVKRIGKGYGNTPVMFINDFAKYFLPKPSQNGVNLMVMVFLIEYYQRAGLVYIDIAIRRNQNGKTGKKHFFITEG